MNNNKVNNKNNKNKVNNKNNKNNVNNKNNKNYVNNINNDVNNKNYSNLYDKWGILDPKGEYINPLTKQPYENVYTEAKNRPNTYEGYAKMWSNLPVYSKRLEFIEEIKKNQVLLVVSGTGSGKTVLVPKFALNALNYNVNKIGITIPKQLIVKDAAEFSAKCLDVKLGDQVGYQYRGSDSSMKSKNNKLLYTTDGTIVAQSLGDPLLSDYDMIIIDEAHERNIQIDFLLLQLKEVLKSRPEFKLIIMSATINSELFKNYFPEKEFKFKMLDAGGGNNYPIKDFFSDKKIPIKMVLEESAKKAFEIIKKEDRDGDILIFVNHKGEGNKGCEILNTLLKNENKNSINPYCGTLASGVPKMDQNMAVNANSYKIEKNKNGKSYTMKIIFATNVAESSLTVEGVNYVIESGYELLQSYDPDRMLDSLNVHMVSNAQRMQRRGRCGRTAPGTCYYMYTKQECEKMEKFPKPAIKKSDLSSEFLKFLGKDNINNVTELFNLLNRLIEPPDKNFIESGLKILFGLNIIDSSGNLTDIGKNISNGRYSGQINPMNSVALYWSYHNYVKNEVAIIISMLEISDGKVDTFFKKFRENKKLNMSKSQQEKQYLKIKKGFANKYGDFLTMLNIYDAYINFKNSNSNKTLKAWCNENNLSDKHLKKVGNDSKNYVRMLMQSMRGERNKINNKNNVNVNANINGNEGYNSNINTNTNNLQGGRYSNSDTENKILSCFLKGYIVNYGRPKANSSKRFYNCFPKNITSTEIDNQSFLLLQKTTPKHFFYGSLQEFSNMTRFTFSNKIPDKVYSDITDVEKNIINECTLKSKQLEKNNKHTSTKKGKSGKKGKFGKKGRSGKKGKSSKKGKFGKRSKKGKFGKRR